VTAYGDPAYRAARAVLAGGEYRCWRGCGAVATTPDHWPPLAEHHHQAGSGCCELRPSCQPCNLAAGATLGNRRRRARAGALTIGRGWSSNE
jgi:hypothetical protein